MANESRTIDLLDGAFYVEGTYDTYAWMREHAPTFGFFETISGEPWHWTWQAG